MASGWRRVDPLEPRLRARVEGVALAAIDDTTAAAAIEAKRNHPGWQNRTGTAEGSVRFDPATRTATGYRGLFGSFDVFYVIFLELLHGHFLRNAADNEFPKLGENLRKRMG